MDYSYEIDEITVTVQVTTALSVSDEESKAGRRKDEYHVVEVLKDRN